MNTIGINYCREVLPAVSRTFALGIELLRDPLRDQVGVSYLICRILDTIEDTTSLPARNREDLLSRAAGELLGGEDWLPCAQAIEDFFSSPSLSAPDQELCRQAPLILETFHSFPEEVKEAARFPITEMAEGMALTVHREEKGNGLRLRTFEELERYCYYVAGTVGRLLTFLFILHRKSLRGAIGGILHAHAVEFGLGLQLTNIIKGVTGDFQRGAVYLPADLFRAEDLLLDDLLANPDDPRGLTIGRKLAKIALSWLDQGAIYTLAFPPEDDDIRLFCALPLFFALRTLKAALVPGIIFSNQPLKITRAEVEEFQERLPEIIREDEALRELYRQERQSVLKLLKPEVP